MDMEAGLAKPQGPAQTGAVILQCSGTSREWRSPTSGLTHIHPAADNASHGRPQREGQLWDQVCPHALAATSGQVRMRKDIRTPRCWAEGASVLMGLGKRREERATALGSPQCNTPTMRKWSSLGPRASKGRRERGPPSPPPHMRDLESRVLNPLPSPPP